MIIIQNLIRTIIFFLLIFVSSYAETLESIKLQLQWKHQFEFAGFYAAKEKGFYEDVGLGVEFVEYKKNTDISKEVLDGNAQYGVTYASIIAEYLNGKPVVLLANFFKQSPLVLIAQKNIDTPTDLKGKRVMGISNSIDGITLTAMLSKFSVTTSNIQNILPSFNIEDFIEKRVDAMAVFTTNELYELDRRGVKYNIFDPTTYGTKYYDVNLFTTKEEIEKNPKRAKDFRDASIKGWEYALEHQDEIVEIILKKYNTQNRTREALVFEAKQIEQIMLPKVYPIGSIDDFRIKAIADNFIQSGFIDGSKEKSLDQFIFKDKIYLTKEEKEFIKKHPQITLGTGNSWEPYSIENSDGTLIGYDQDILSIINKVTGANFIQVRGDWSKIQKMAKNQKIDGLSTLTQTKKRDEFLNFSSTYISLQKMVMVKQRNPLNITKYSDLDGKTIVVHKGNVADEKAAKEFKNSKIIYASTPQKALEEVIYGKADATFGNGATEYMLSKLGLPYMDNAFALQDSLNLKFGVRKDWSEAISILNKGLSTISKHKLIQLKQKWFLGKEVVPKIIFDSKELSYLKSKKEIKMCVDPNWMPLEKIEDGKYIGLAAEYMRLFSKQIETPISLVKTSTWNESLEKIKNRECDILPLAQRTPSRDKYLNFTKSYIEIPLVITTKTDIPFIDDIKYIYNKKLGVVKGYSYSEKLKLKYPNINIVEVDSIDDGFKKVEKGEIFGYIDNSIVANYEIQKNYMGILSISAKLEDRLDLSVAIGDDEKILYQIFEKVLLELNEGEKQKILNNWVNTSYNSKADYILVWQIIAIFLFIIILFLVRQHNINKMNVRLKNEIEIAINKSKEQDKFIFQQNKLAAMGDMIGSIAHQWRQPLAVVNTAIAILLEKDNKNILSNDKLREKLYLMETNVLQMSQTIEDFLSYFNPYKEKNNFVLLDIVGKALWILKEQISNKDIKISIIVDSKIVIHGYKDEYMQVLISIITNSIQAFDKDKTNEITFNAYTTQDEVVLIIGDNAGGIDENKVDKIFDPYFTTKHQGKGTGLGLYISKMIIENSMRGKLNAKNIENGVRFLIEVDK